MNNWQMYLFSAELLGYSFGFFLEKYVMIILIISLFLFG